MGMIGTWPQVWLPLEAAQVLLLNTLVATHGGVDLACRHEEGHTLGQELTESPRPRNGWKRRSSDSHHSAGQGN